MLILCYFPLLSVSRPPKIILQPENRTIYFRPGYPAEILCEADGVPQPTYVKHPYTVSVSLVLSFIISSVLLFNCFCLAMFSIANSYVNVSKVTLA